MGRWWASRRGSARDSASHAAAEQVAPRPGHPAQAPPPRSEWLGDGVLLIGPDEAGTAAAIAVDLPVEPGAVTVISLLADARDWRWLTDAIASAVPAGVAVRLAVSNAGTSRDSDPPPAQRLAERLGTAVIAPDGPVLLTPGGSAFVAARAGTATGERAARCDSGAGQWLWFRPDGTVLPAGPRYPPPEWAQAPRAVAEHPAGAAFVQIPAGLWWLGEPTARAPLSDLAYGMPADPARCAVVIGTAGGARPDPAPILDALTNLPAPERGRMLIVPYGSGVRCAVEVATALAGRWQLDVALANGMPMRDPRGVRRTLATEEDGTPLWWPMTQLLWCGADGPPRPDTTTQAPPAGGGHAPGDPWVVQTTHFGLWVRHRDLPADPAQVARIPWDPRWLTVVAGVPGHPAEGIRPALAGLLASLPAQARARVRVVSPDLLSRLGVTSR